MRRKKLNKIIAATIIVFLAFIILWTFFRWKFRDETLRYVDISGMIIDVQWYDSNDSRYMLSILLKSESSDCTHVFSRVYVRKSTILKSYSSKRVEFSELREGQVVKATVLNRVTYGENTVDPETGQPYVEEWLYDCRKIQIMDELP